jgi:ribosomal protein S18 acetylase RimI-like enzyme
MAFSAHQFARDDLPRLNAFISANAVARAPVPVYLMTSDVAWRMPGSGPKQNLRLWQDAAGLAGFVWFEPTTGMEFDLRHDLPYDHPIAADMLAWSEARRREFAPAYPRFVDLQSMDEWSEEILHPRERAPDGQRWLTAMAFESDTARVALLEASGYRPTRHFMPDYRRDLSLPIPPSRLADGLQLRHVTAADLDERVAVHRSSWLRSTWSPDTYLKIRAGDVYDAELDIVLETGDGTFAAYCICWPDSIAGVGSYEPVGTRPEWRGKGVGREVIYEGFRRLKAKGMRVARVGTAGFNAPAQALYESCGFVRVGTCRTYLKRLA